MRIGIEAQRVFRKKKGGMDVVAMEIIRNLQRIDKENEYFIYTAYNSDAVQSIEETENFRIKYVKGVSYVDWEQVWLPLQARKDKIDLLHCTSNTAPLWCPVPKMVTVHDIIYLEKASWPVNVNWYQRLGNQYRSLVVPKIVQGSEAIVTVSEFEKSNLVEHFGLDPSRVQVVHNGVNASFQRVTDQSVLSRVRSKYQLPGNFILYLGNTEPRKNIRNMLKAYSLLNARVSDAPSLVITNISNDYLDKILTEIGEEAIRMKITLTGYADFRDLPALYSLATFYAYPSFREGFGLPILEAMACGTAVITSNVSSMPEIAGAAALMVNPEDPHSIAEAMKKYLQNPLMKQEKIQLGSLRYQQFTWEAAARKLLTIYHSLANKQSHHEIRKAA